MNTRGNLVLLMGASSAFILAACGSSNFQQSDASNIGSGSGTVCPAYGCNTGGTGAAPYILSFNPASASTLPSFPTQVQIYFNENMDQTTVQDLSNWSFQCSTGTAVISSVVATSPVSATVYAQGNSIQNNSTCSLTAARTITDVSGAALAGTTTVAYTIGSGSGGGSTDVTAPTGSITTPWDNDRIFGTMTFAATAQDLGTNASGVAKVEFYIDSVLVGSATSSVGGYWQAAFDTTAVSNGPSTLSIRVTDNAGNVNPSADTKTVYVQNFSQSTSSTVGGTGGSAFTDQKAFLAHMSGFRVRYTGTGVTGEIASIQPTFKQAYASDFSEDGAIHGSNSGTVYQSSCPTTHRVSGFWLKANTVVTRIGLICKKYTDSSDRQLLGRVGGTAGNEFTLECPENTFVKALKGRSGARVDQLQLVCQ